MANEYGASFALHTFNTTSRHPLTDDLLGDCGFGAWPSPDLWPPTDRTGGLVEFSGHETIAMRARDELHGTHVARDIVQQDCDHRRCGHGKSVKVIVRAEILMPVQDLARRWFEMKLGLVEIEVTAHNLP